MAKNRSARLRKKLRVDEFQELGFDINWTFNSDISESEIDTIVDKFISDVIEARELGFHGGGHLQWEGIIATQRLGKCSQDDRAAVSEFWQTQKVSQVNVGELYDIWWS